MAQADGPVRASGRRLIRWGVRGPTTGIPTQVRPRPGEGAGMLGTEEGQTQVVRSQAPQHPGDSGAGLQGVLPPEEVIWSSRVPPAGAREIRPSLIPCFRGHLQRWIEFLPLLLCNKGLGLWCPRKGDCWAWKPAAQTEPPDSLSSGGPGRSPRWSGQSQASHVTEGGRNGCPPPPRRERGTGLHLPCLGGCVWSISTLVTLMEFLCLS